MSNELRNELDAFETRFKSINGLMSRKERYELITKMHAFLERYDYQAYRQTLDKIVDAYHKERTDAAGLLRDGMIGVLNAFRSDFQAGYIIEPGIH